ncbi:hypothetical protein KIL84_018663, partial [Mauremys mutica]
MFKATCSALHSSSSVGNDRPQELGEQIIIAMERVDVKAFINICCRDLFVCGIYWLTVRRSTSHYGMKFTAVQRAYIEVVRWGARIIGWGRLCLLKQPCVAPPMLRLEAPSAA